MFVPCIQVKPQIKLGKGVRSLINEIIWVSWNIFFWSQWWKWNEKQTEPKIDAWSAGPVTKRMCVKRFIVFFLSLMVSEVLVFVDIIFKELHNRSSFLLQPISFPIEIHMKHECYQLSEVLVGAQNKQQVRNKWYALCGPYLVTITSQMLHVWNMYLHSGVPYMDPMGMPSW